MRKVAVIYMVQSLALIAVVTALAFLCITSWGDWSLMGMPTVVAAGFQLLACLVYGMFWRAVACRSSASLPVFYLAASGIRMLAGIATVVIYLFLVSEASSVRFFVSVFLAYYFLLLVYDTLYFVNVEKKIRQNV